MQQRWMSLLWICLLFAVSCDDLEEERERALIDSQLTGLRYLDVMCGNLWLDSGSLAFASQSLEEGVYEVLVEVNGYEIDWMVDENLGVEALSCDSATLSDDHRALLRALHEALVAWFDLGETEPSAHEVLCLELLVRLESDKTLRCGSAVAWSSRPSIGR